MDANSGEPWSEMDISDLTHSLDYGDANSELPVQGRGRGAPEGEGAWAGRAAREATLLHFTSGTTGRPKGAVHVHEAVVAHHITGQLALDLRPNDIFWCTADPGWVTGTSYGIISPLTNGATLIVDQAEFDAERWYRILQDHKITVWYTAPTAIRMLMKTGAEIAKRFELSKLRLMASVGEPLNPEAVVWGVEAFGKPFHDNRWQTETGGIMISNYPSMWGMRRWRTQRVNRNRVPSGWILTVA